MKLKKTNIINGKRKKREPGPPRCFIICSFTCQHGEWCRVYFTPFWVSFLAIKIRSQEKRKTQKEN